MYIFGKADDEKDNQVWPGYSFKELISVVLFRSNNTGMIQNDPNYLRTVVDEAGYLHLLAVFPASGGTWTSPAPITTAVAQINTSPTPGSTNQTIVACLDPPKYILDNQNIHVDIRLRNA